jgi:hypothetical protein
VAYVLYKLNRKLNLPGLTVGSMFPDLETPTLFLLFEYRFPPRLILHSLLGATTIGTIFSVAFTVLIYPTLSSYFFKIDKVKVKERSRVSLGLVFSCLLGNLSHVLLDVTNHPYSPLFWPLSPPTLSPICLALGGMVNASLIVHTFIAILFVALFINQREDILERLLVGE